MKSRSAQMSPLSGFHVFFEVTMMLTVRGQIQTWPLLTPSVQISYQDKTTLVKSSRTLERHASNATPKRQTLWNPTVCGLGSSNALGLRGGSIGRALNSRFKDPEFKPRPPSGAQETFVRGFFPPRVKNVVLTRCRVKNVVLTRCRCSTPSNPVCTCMHTNDHVRTLKIL